MCDVWVTAKLSRKASNGQPIARSPNVTIHGNICEPFQAPTFGGQRYFVTLTTAPQRFVRVYLKKNRPEVEEYMHEYIAWVKRNVF